VPELVLQLTRAAFLALLWLFVFAALRVVRSDLYAASGLRAATPGRRPSRGGTSKPGRGGGRSTGPKALIVTAGALAGTRIALDGRPIMLGRADDSTLVLDDDYASTRHARISQSGNDWYVEDLGSTNGTYVNSEQISKAVRLGKGDMLQIGSTVFEVSR
jgi:pSer/pThr/pTyr-binding forkhead associated (FHA) protein